MENKGVDNIIKQKLQNFEVDLNPTDWQFMEEMLAAEEVDIADEAAKDKLQNHEVPFDATGWAAMNLALDDLAAAEMVDEVVKENLETFEVPYSAADWSIMGAMLDAEMPDETPTEPTDEVDELARAALAAFSVPFSLSEWEMMDMELDELGFPHEADEAAKTALQNYETAMPSDWAGMETALSSAEKVRRQLIITKSIEVALFIFAIWTIGNFLPFEKEHSNAIINTLDQVNTLDNQPQANSDIINEATIDILESVNGSLVSSSIDNEENNSIINSNNRSNVINGNFNNNKTDLNFLPNRAIIPPLESEQEETVATKMDKPIANLNRLPLQEQFVTYPNGKGSAFGKSKEKQVRNQAVYLDTKQLALVGEEYLPSSTVSTNYKKDELRFRVALTPQYCFFSNDENLNSRKIASGFATNIGVDYAISDKVEISSGITYNRKSYVQQQQQEFTNAQSQFTLNSVRDVALEIIQIPVHVNYNIIKNDKTRLYITGGATAGLIMKVDKNTQQVSLANSVYNLGNANFAADAQSTSSLSEKSEGALQNGEISTNTFITADLGLGLEYQATNRLSFFIEPLYQRSLNKIGIDAENYQNYAFSVGSRVIL
jgi:opacity protein-like surface antigen